ncbi:hypothetical protein ACPOL_0177 [Acidisarcina polymorpha]|uniref:Uncharacterized protein n=1 Tax=Acidisarcina polymorpha TaxID=2211140 RepID=A0A2Z5FS35_9BACT|nr:hypothetical protein ACPOL_0177 [Acidisarcina polymorpha]
MGGVLAAGVDCGFAVDLTVALPGMLPSLNFSRNIPTEF